MQLNKTQLFKTFGVDNFIKLDSAIQNMSPSMVEYYLSDLGNYSEELYLNKSQIQNQINIGEYNLYVDYEENVFLEVFKSENSYETASLW